MFRQKIIIFCYACGCECPIWHKHNILKVLLALVLLIDWAVPLEWMTFLKKVLLPCNVLSMRKLLIHLILPDSDVMKKLLFWTLFGR